MDFTSLIIGIALGIWGLSINRIMHLLKMILSFITSFMLLKLGYNVRLLSIFDYNDENFIQYFNSDIFTPSLVYCVLSLIFFYWLLPIILDTLIKSKIQKFIDCKYPMNQPISDLIIKLSINRGVRLLFSILRKSKVYYPSKLITEKEEVVTYTEIKKTIIDLACIGLHILICLIFLIHNIWMSIVIITLYFISCFWALIAIPVFRSHKNYFLKILVLEHNKEIE